MPSKSTSNGLAFRPADPRDCAHLVLFADMATRRLTSYLWGKMAAPGQSAFEVGRNVIRNDQTHFTHLRNWRVAEDGDKMVGAVNGYIIPQPSCFAVTADQALAPLNELKAMAAGTWYISAIAVYPEHQGNGHGKSLLAHAQRLAQAAGSKHLTLMVGSFNTQAHDLYRKTGFREWDRRAFTAFPGSDEPGQWILMVKDLA
ncbi:GNAT family N-acetyltransferase [Bordetella sp. FB-8]|uniref:GNAT family N-acetyltransferase n=1 Tax=Bordetella sp. FB-8 TaxID=1159870 RepID=UPI00036F825A|nr:GNAT family N-acetyltransferase [Bordetella sp. FB-8]